MGISSAPDIFQSIMDDVLGDLEFVRCYIDDILIISNGTFEDHMEKLDIVLSRVEQAGFRANVRKCFFAEDELEYLGYILTREGVKPQPKKVEAILRLQAPKNVKQLRTFLGMVNYYRDMWRRRSHLLAPLSALLSKKKSFDWTKECQESFEEIKRVISQEAMLAFPDFTKTFHIYTDASDYQLGGVIMQDGKPLAFYTRKLNGAQKRYSTGEQELLGIVETLKEFRHILLGQHIVVHTDHKNIVYGNLTNDRIVRWRLLLEEFGPEYVHVAGKDNVVADALSRLDIERKDTDDLPVEEIRWFRPSKQQQEQAYVTCQCMAMLTKDETEYDCTELLEECYVGSETEGKLSNEELERFPMAPSLIAKAQRLDKKLQKEVKKRGEDYTRIEVEDHVLLHHKDRIVVPQILQQRVVAWVHQYLSHPGATRMEKTIGRLFTWTGMRDDIRGFVKTCKKCQLCKTSTKKYVKLPPKEAEPAIPWNRVNVDLVGPYPVKIKGSKEDIQLRAMTMIDPTTGWFEVREVDEPTADCCQQVFDDTWLSRYPRPQYIGFDNGSEFKSVFSELVQNMGMKKKKSLAYNPQSNGIVERVHQVLGNMLRTMELEEEELDKKRPFEPFLAAAAYSIRSTYHTTLEATPAELVFGRNMLLPIQFKADWESIRARRQTFINKNNERENKNRLDHQYKVGDLVSKFRPGKLRKLRRRKDGPFRVESVPDNGTIRIRKGAVLETVNVRRVEPYHEANADA